MEYHKIQTVFKRDERGKIILDEYSTPELGYLAGNIWGFTEKVDGTNIRVIWDGNAVSFGGRTDNAQIPAKLLNKLSETFDNTDSLERMRQKLSDGAILFGEGYGAGIQKGGGNYISDGCDFVLFDVRVGNWWLERHNVIDIGCALGLSLIPTLGFGTLPEMVEMVREGVNSMWGDFPAEGIVARPIVELQTRGGERIITKLKNRDFR